jgi:hypothetical protein
VQCDETQIYIFGGDAAENFYNDINIYDTSACTRVNLSNTQALALSWSLFDYLRFRFRFVSLLIWFETKSGKQIWTKPDATGPKPPGISRYGLLSHPSLI